MVKLSPPWEEVLFSWLHVSDIHIGHGDAAHGWDQKLVLETLRRDVADLLEQRQVPSPESILVTGDIAFSGATSAADEYIRAAQWLTSLAKVVRLDASKVLVVPGNHDVQRSVDRSARNVGRLIRGLRAGAEPFDESLANPDDVALLSQRLANYLAFAQDFGPPRSEAEVVENPLYWRLVLRAKSGLNIRFAGLNTALLAADNQDRGKLRLGNAQLAHALLDHDPGPTVSILLSHHPFREGWVADEAHVSNWVRNHAHVHLSGHVHLATAEQVVSAGGIGFIHVTAGAAHGEADETARTSHGYNFGALVRSKTGDVGLVVWPRRWSPKKAKFCLDTDNVLEGATHSAHLVADVTLGRHTDPDDWQTEPENLRGWRATSSAQHSGSSRFNVPFAPNPHFCGRSIELDKLKSEWKSTAAGRPPRPQVVHGLGGVGKTQLVVEYAWREREQYGAVLWVEADSAKSFRENLAALVESMDLREREARQQSVRMEAVLRWLQDSRGWLLVIDNVDTDEVQSAVFDALPKAAMGHILITSRIGSWELPTQVHLVDVLPLEEAAQFLINRTRGHVSPSKDDAIRVAQRIGGFPLALEQAASYVIESSEDFAQYLQQLESVRAPVFEHRTVGATGLAQERSAVATTWIVTEAKLSAGARALLRLVSFFAPDEIPRDLFLRANTVVSDAAKLLGEELPSFDDAGWSEFVRKCLRELKKYSLITLGSTTFSCHRLVKEVQRLRIAPAENVCWMKLVVTSFNSSLLGQVDDVRNRDEIKPHLAQVVEASDQANNPDLLHESQALRPVAERLKERTLASIHKFREEYLAGDPGAPSVAFGGRAREMAALDAWLENEAAPPRLLLTAPAGRGKSALLVRWLERLQEQGLAAESAPSTAVRWQTVFVPISIRFGTNLPEKYLQALANRLAQIVGKTPEPPAVDLVGFYTEQVQELLQELDSKGTRVLVVLDGLDEALRGEFNADLFPRRLSGNVRTLVSARLQLGDVDSAGWRKRLGWRSTQPCAFLELEPLDASGIRDVLEKLGTPVDELSGGPSITRRLVELTQGDPLSLRYYAEDLAGLAIKIGTRVTREDLETLTSGFGAYFSRWLEHQEKAWNEAGDQVDRDAVDAVLMALSFSHGPLEATDLVAVLRHLPNAPKILRIQHVLDALRRFVIGNGQRDHGYVLAHPKIGEHLKRERFAHAADVLERAFIAWGRETVARVNDNPDQCERVSAYLVQFYRRHLEDADAPLADLMALVEDGWRRSWEYYEGSPRSFSGDVGTALSRARRNGHLSELGAQLRCVITLSSIRSVGVNVPGELLFHAVEAGVVGVRQAEHLARFMRAADEGAVTLGRLAATFEWDPVIRAKLFDEALTTALAMGDECARAEALIRLAEHLPEPREKVLREALKAAKAISEEHARARALIGLAQHLQPELLPEALEAAKAIENTNALSRALAALGARLPVELRQQVLSDALDAAKAIGDESTRAEALSALAEHLPVDLLREALNAAEAICHAPARARAVSGLAPRLQPELRQRVLSSALDAVHANPYRAWTLVILAPHLPELFSEALQAVKGGSLQANALAELAPHLPPELISEALDVAKAISDERPRARALNALVPRMPPELRPPVLREALKAAKAISPQHARAGALNDLAKHLPPELISEALDATKAIGDGHARAVALNALALHLSPELRQRALREALDLAKAIGDANSRAATLSTLAPHLPSELISEALDVGMAMRWGDRSLVLSALAPRLPPEQREQVLSEAVEAKRRWGEAVVGDSSAFMPRQLPPELCEQYLSEALDSWKACGDALLWVQELSRSAQYLPSDRISEAFATAKDICNNYTLPKALSILAPRLPPELLCEALDAAKAIRHEQSRAEALSGLAPRLPPELLCEALDAAKAIRHEQSRAEALSGLAPHLPPELLSEALAAILATAERLTRDNLLLTLTPFAAAIKERGGDRAIRGLRRAILDAAQWYP
jgi:3',5'-cyclic AMP phosphodiesterase CpdA